MPYKEYKPTYISTGATTQVATGKGVLQAITVNSPAAGTITIIDGTSGSTANIGVLKSGVAEGTYWFNCTFANGLRIITGAASDITVTWMQG